MSEANQRDAVTDRERTVSTMLVQEALVRIPVRKGLVPKEQILDELQTVRIETTEDRKERHRAVEKAP